MDLKLCRVCCINSGNSNIFQTAADGILVSEKIMYCCSNVRVTDDDGLPSFICSGCEQELVITYQFILKCEATDKTLRSQNIDFTNIKNVDCNPKLEVKNEDYNCLESDTLIENNIGLNFESDEDFNVPLSVFNQTKKSEVSGVRMSMRKTIKKTFCKDSGPQCCSICSRQCQNPSTLYAHMRSHRDDRPFHCVSCDKRYKDPGSLKRHNIRNHLENRERRFICETCGKGFYSKTDVAIHLRTHTGEAPYTCSECSSCFTQLSSLIRHKSKHSNEKTQVCSICSKRFGNKDRLKAHLRVHTETNKKFSCKICSVLFKYKTSYNKHMKMHNQPSCFVCNYCGRTFNLKGNLKSHIDRIHSEKSGFCNNCNKIVSNMEVHMWRHTGQRPLKCEHCSSSFYELKALAHHMNFRHKYPDKYKCTVEGCFRSFPSQPMLKYHIAKIHESQIKFPCDQCARGFYRKNDLSRHKIGTHKEKLQ